MNYKYTERSHKYDRFVIDIEDWDEIDRSLELWLNELEENT